MCVVLQPPPTFIMNQGIDLTDEVHSRNMRDFLELFNKITNHCFDKCISNFNERSVTREEAKCVSDCTNKYLQFNQRNMLIFMEHQTNKQKRAIREAEQAAQQAEKTVAMRGDISSADSAAEDL